MLELAKTINKLRKNIISSIQCIPINFYQIIRTQCFIVRKSRWISFVLEQKNKCWGKYPTDSYVSKNDDSDDADDVFQKTGEIITPLEKEIIMEDQDCENNELGV